MPLLKSKKEEIIKDLEKAIKENKSLVFVNFHGLSVGEETKLRRDLREKGVSYKVSRKTLLKCALLGKAEGEIPELPGEIAIAYLPAEASAKAGGKDDIAPAREIYNFQTTHQKSNPGILNILGGIFEGKFIGGPAMTELAMIPSREVLLGKLVNIINSPIQRFVVALNQIAINKK